MALKRIVLLVLFAWLARWAAGEIAAYAGRHWRRSGPSPLEWGPPEPAPRAPSDE